MGINQMINTEKLGTILAVDDDPSVLIVIQTILAAADYRVLLAATGKDALRLVKQHYLRIDLVLLDIRMPGMRPIKLADKILARRPDMPIVFMSGLVDDEVIRIRFLDEYAGFLPKPFKRDCLLGIVGQVMEARAQPDSAVECTVLRAMVGGA
jgi:CheY-like chemotaxis protein